MKTIEDAAAFAHFGSNKNQSQNQSRGEVMIHHRHSLVVGYFGYLSLNTEPESESLLRAMAAKLVDVDNRHTCSSCTTTTTSSNSQLIVNCQR